ncbi:MAG: hypothetical protein LBT16_08170 [Treponema sp.]|jgi:hypothetical protein|nr:hypothetical protein [Treponema sp.]
MTKQQQWIIKYIVHDIIGYIMEDSGSTLAEAMNRFYTSEVFEKLQDIETGLYSEGSGYVYDLYKIERQYGKLIQLEV